MKEIRIDVGVHTALTVKLLEVDFAGMEKVIFTVKNYADPDSPTIVERVFTEPGLHSIVITPEESIRLTDHAVYDFNQVMTDGTRLKMTDTGKIVLRRSVGDCID